MSFLLAQTPEPHCPDNRTPLFTNRTPLFYLPRYYYSSLIPRLLANQYVHVVLCSSLWGLHLQARRETCLQMEVCIYATFQLPRKDLTKTILLCCQDWGGGGGGGRRRRRVARSQAFLSRCRPFTAKIKREEGLVKLIT